MNISTPTILPKPTRQKPQLIKPKQPLLKNTIDSTTKLINLLNSIPTHTLNITHQSQVDSRTLVYQLETFANTIQKSGNQTLYNMAHTKPIFLTEPFKSHFQLRLNTEAGNLSTTMKPKVNPRITITVGV